MKQILKSIFLIIIIFNLTSCNETYKKHSITINEKEQIKKPEFLTNEKFLTKHSDSCGCKAQYELKDSLKLTQIKNQFYKSKTGHLYERTMAQKETGDPNNIKFEEYFNGKFSQEIDPHTFIELNGWYAKDKKNVYYYRPVSGGMQISKLDRADSKTFKILKGHYKYGVDNNHFYDETEIIENYIPSKTRLKFDHKERVIEMKCNANVYKFETVN